MRDKKAAIEAIVWKVAAGTPATTEERELVAESMSNQEFMEETRRRGQILLQGQRLGSIGDIQTRKDEVVEAEKYLNDVENEHASSIAELLDELNERRTAISGAAAAVAAAELAAEADVAREIELFRLAAPDQRASYEADRAALDEQYSLRNVLSKRLSDLLETKDFAKRVGGGLKLSKHANRLESVEDFEELGLKTASDLVAWFETEGDRRIEVIRSESVRVATEHRQHCIDLRTRFAMSLVPK